MWIGKHGYIKSLLRLSLWPCSPLPPSPTCHPNWPAFCWVPQFSITSWQFLLLRGPVHSFWCQVLLQSIVSEVDAAWWALMHQLIAALRTDLQLPRCLQVVGYLRRMQIFSEAELRLKFLQVRDSWLQSELAKIPTDDGTNVAYSLKLVIYL